MTRVLALILGGLCAIPAMGVSPDPKDLAIPPQELSKARDLIRRLGSEAYREREEAQTELARMGRLARPVLLEAVGSDPDPEVRFRCSRLLPRAGVEDLKARIDTYLADADGKFEHDLPGLKQFRKQVGTDKADRELFVEIIKSSHNIDLLQALDRTPAEAGRAISDRRMTLYSRLNNRIVGGRVQPPPQIPLPDIACLLLAESVVPSKDIPRGGMWSFVTGITFVQQPSSMAGITNNGTPHSAGYRKIIGKWLETRDDVQDLNQLAYTVGQNLSTFKESEPLLRKIVMTEGVYGYAKGQALMFLVQKYGKDERNFLQKLLTNETLVTTVWFGAVNNQAVQHQCLLRDVALAMLIKQTKQDMKDYGYVFPQGFVGDQIGYGNYAFPSDEARGRAMVKFGFWRLKQSFKAPAKSE